MSLNTIHKCGSCSSSIGNSFIEDLQAQIIQSLAKQSYRESKSKSNDLGLCINTQNFNDLVVWNELLEELLWCNPCFKSDGELLEDMINVIKKDLA